MRILGRCPWCGAEDTLFGVRGTGFEVTVSCENCEASEISEHGVWSFLDAEKAKGNKLIAVEVSNRGLVVCLELPSLQDIPHARLIAQVLNAALLVRFKLRRCFAAEGGVQGHFRDGPVELRNLDSDFGLAESEYHFSRASRRILRWYEKLLCALFEEDLRLEHRRYGRGAILKLSNGPKDAPNALILLWAAITKIEGKKFAVEVFRELEELKRSPSGIAHLAGLTDEDIAAIFVPPPGFEKLFGEQSQ